jgi:hypothetical protein
MYGSRCSEADQLAIKGILHYENEEFEEKDLGLPVPEGRMVEGKFKTYKERYQKRLNNWTEKYLSSGEKEALIKSVLQAMPIYAMGIFKFPAGLIDYLE